MYSARSSEPVPPPAHSSGTFAASHPRNSSRNSLSPGVKFKSISTSIRLRSRSLPQKLGHVHDLHLAVATARVDAVLQHRHAEGAPDGEHVGAGLQGLTRALLVDALVGRLVHEAHPAAAAAAEAVAARARHLDRVPARRDLHERARRVVDAVLPAEVTGVVKSHLPARLREGLEPPLLDQPREELAVMQDLERAAVVRVLVPEGV